MCDKQAYTYVRSLGTCIRRDTTLSSFADARASCHVEGGSLLEVKTNATKLYIKQIMLDITGNTVNSELFARFLFSRVVLKDIF